MFKKSLFCFYIIFFSTFLLANDAPARKPVRIYADIVGDLFHMGHVEFFKKARELGDYLIIGVLSDETVASYKRVPILTMEERGAVIGACKYVDEVILNPPLRTSREWLEEHQIDLVVHGDDFNLDLIHDQYGVPFEMGIFKLVPYTRGISSTDIIKRIKERGFE